MMYIKLTQLDVERPIANSSTPVKAGGGGGSGHPRQTAQVRRH